jgi:hypothetical protein
MRLEGAELPAGERRHDPLQLTKSVASAKVDTMSAAMPPL